MSRLNIDSVMLDTSFCIRLMDEHDVLHEQALAYFRHFATKEITMHLSTIAVAEYAVGDDPANLPLDQLQIESFDFLDGQIAGQFFQAIKRNKQAIEGYNRKIIVNDVKILAQTHKRKIQAIISKDAKSFREHVQPLLHLQMIDVQFLDLNLPLHEALGELFA